MARQFSSAGGGTGIRREAAVVTGPPFTVGVWFNLPDALSQNLFFLGTSTTEDHRWSFAARGDAVGDPLQIVVRTTGNVTQTTSSPYTPNVWQHGCFVTGSSTDHRVYVNGGSKGASVVASAPAGFNRTSCGRSDRLTADSFANGSLADLVVWNAALTDDEVAMIARPGFPMHRYRSQNIKLYWRLGIGSPEPDWSGNGFHGTLVNAPTIADHVGSSLPFGYDTASPAQIVRAYPTSDEAVGNWTAVP
jgi:hypothetical protein